MGALEAKIFACKHLISVFGTVWSVLKCKYSYGSSSFIWYWVIGCNMVTWPIPLVKPSLKSTLAPTFRYSGCLMNLKSTTAFSPVLSSSCINQTTQMQDSEAEEHSQRSNCSKCGTDRVIHSFHCGRLSHVAYVHGNLETLVKGLCVKEQHNLGLKPPADGGVHLRAHHHHPLQGTNRPYKWHGRHPSWSGANIRRLQTVPTLRRSDRSKLPRASVAAWPALSTRHAERFLWMLPMDSLWNCPESVGPTTRGSPSRQMPLHIWREWWSILNRNQRETVNYIF